MNVLISHQTGATMSVLSLQMMQFTPMLKVCTTCQNAKKADANVPRPQSLPREGQKHKDRCE